MANVTFDLIGSPVIVPPLGLDGNSGIRYNLNLPTDVSGAITIQGNFFTQRPAVGQSATLVKMGPIHLQVTTTGTTTGTNGNYIYLVKYTITQDATDYTGYYANPTSYPNPTGLFYVNPYTDPLYPYTDLAFVNIVLQRSDVSTQAWRLWINGDPTDWPTTPYGDDVLGQEIFVGCSDMAAANGYLGECSDLWVSDTDRYDAGDGQGIDILAPVVDGFTLLYTPFTQGFGNQ
jgi:hypothetical protein